MEGDNLAPRQGKGPVIGIIIIIILLVAGALYVMNKDGVSSDNLDGSATSTMSTSTEINDIEADLNETDVGTIDAELNQLDAELKI